MRATMNTADVYRWLAEQIRASYMNGTADPLMRRNWELGRLAVHHATEVNRLQARIDELEERNGREIRGLLIEDIVRNQGWYQLCDEAGMDPETDPADLADALAALTDGEIIDPEGLHTVLCRLQADRNQLSDQDEYARSEGPHERFTEDGR